MIRPRWRAAGLPAFVHLVLLILLVLVPAALPAAAVPTGWCNPSAAPESVRRAILGRADARLHAAPRALPEVRTAGLLPGQGIREASLRARRDLPQMRTFALAWRMGQDARYLHALERLLDAWLKVYRISFHHVDETHFDAMVDAYALSASALPAPVAARTASFLHTMASGYVQRMDAGRGQKEATWINNWQSHRIKLVTLIAVALEDEALFGEARRLFTIHLDANIREDGSVEDFHQRDALHYVVYDLEPLVRAAMAARFRNEQWLDLAGRSGTTVASALEWLRPYSEGRKQHEEFVRSSVSFDTRRRAAGVAGFAGTWSPRRSSTLYWMASRLDARYLATARALSAPPDWIAACGA